MMDHPSDVASEATFHTSRRSLLTGLAASIAVPLAAGAAQGAPSIGDEAMSMHNPIIGESMTGKAGEFARLAAVYRDCERAREKFCTSIENLALENYRVGVAGLPHRVTEASFVSHGGQTRLGTEAADMVKLGRSLAALKPQVQPTDEYIRTLLELASLADERDEELSRLRKKLDIDRILEMESDLSGRVVEAENAAITAPVASLQELSQKADFLDELDGWEWDNAIKAIAADIRRLASALHQS